MLADGQLSKVQNDDRAMDKQIGFRLHLQRVCREMSEDACAQRLEIPTATLVSYETGENPVPASTLARVSNLLAVPIDFFFRPIADVPNAKAVNVGQVGVDEVGELVGAYMAVADRKTRGQVVKLIRALTEETA